MSGVSGIPVAARTTARELARQRRRYTARHVAARATVHAVAAAAALVCAAPFLYGLAGSRADPGSGLSLVARLRFLMRATPFPHLVGGTLVVGALVAAGTVLVAVPAAYALARSRGSWGARARVAIFAVAVVPPTLPVWPLSRMVTASGLRGSLWPLVIVYPTITVPVAVWLLSGCCARVPVDVEEQALVDGRTRLGAFVRVVVPLLAPAITAVAVLSFVLAAGDFTYAHAFAPPAAPTTVSTGLSSAAGGGPAWWPAARAGIVVVAVPAALAANLVLDRIIASALGRADRTEPSSDDPIL